MSFFFECQHYDELNKRKVKLIQLMRGKGHPFCKWKRDISFNSTFNRLEMNEHTSNDLSNRIKVQQSFHSQTLINHNKRL